MKEKIIAALKAKFPAVNLSQKRLDEIAAKLEAKVTDETQIDAQLDAFNDFNPVAEIAKTDDRLRDQENKLKKLGQQKPPVKKKEEEEIVIDDDDKETPSWAKKILESNKTLLGKVEALEGEKQQTTIKAKLAEKLKDVPQFIWAKRILPTKDDEIEAFITDVTTDYSAYTKEMTEKGILNIPPPGAGGDKDEDVKKASKEEVDKVMETIM